MEQRTVEVNNGLKFTFAVPSNSEEADRDFFKVPGACCKEAVSNYIYRGGLPRAYDLLAKALEAKYPDKKVQKFPHATKVDKEGKPVMVAESDIVFVNRVAAELGTTPSEFQTLVDNEVTPKLGSDWTAQRREAGPKEVSAKKKFLEQAKAVLADPDADRLPRTLKKIRKLGVEVTEPVTEQSLALALQAAVEAMSG